MGDISSSNAVLMLSIPDLFPTPVQIQQFAADDVYDLDDIESVETSMGVDGTLSGGWTWKPQPQRIMLQADSVSNELFDQWYNTQANLQRALVANGVLILPSISKKFIQVSGFLTTYKLPGAKRTLTPRGYRITWARVTAVPA